MVYRFTESDVEEAALSWFDELGYVVLSGPDIAFDGSAPERKSYADVILEERVRDAIERFNPDIPEEARTEALRKLTRVDTPTLLANNRSFHRLLVNGVPVEYRRRDGSIAHGDVKIVNFDDPSQNDMVAVNQFTVIEGQYNRRPDIVVFVNGLPLAVIELKNAADENVTIWTAFRQLQTYKLQVPSLFVFNEALVISDGLDARVGSLTANEEWFSPWWTIKGEQLAPENVPQVDVLIQGLFEPRRFLDFVRHFVVFEEDESGLAIKKLARYHQYHAVNGAVEATVEASGTKGDKRCGVVWHTQGSGKSLTMAFYAGKVILHPKMKNPTLVVLTDRNDLDEQLFGTFAGCHELLRQKPVRADSRSHLRELLTVASGGVVFTTVHKFFPEEKGDKHALLSDRRNIVVVADEAHRSQYDFIDGFARHMRDALPSASFIGFTGTPIELADKNTRAVFGDYISIYDIKRAVEDGATVPIYYESRLANLELNEKERPRIDVEFEEITEGEEQTKKEKLKTKWAALEALVGTHKRLSLIARDLVEHFDRRLEAMDGKAMIVCMSRRICVELYRELVKLRPDWHDPDDKKGTLKVIMTGSPSDPLDWQEHIRNKRRRETLADRFKDPADPFKVVIVRDMWLTGFDAPCLHTMYIDKPMRGHGLMQAIARVNRVFRDKPGGLVVDYLGLAPHLKKALAIYTESGGQGEAALDQEEAVSVMQERYEVCCGLFHGFDWSTWTKGKPTQKLRLLPLAQEHILAQEEGKERLLKAVTELSKAFALSVPHPEALRIQDDVAFFQAVRAAIAKSSSRSEKRPEDFDHAIQQIVSKAVDPGEVVDLFRSAGLKRPDISILSDEFLAEVQGMPHKNLAVEVLRKLLNDEIRLRSRKNLIQSRSFSEMLERSLRAYQNRAIEAAQVIEQLIKLAKDMREAQKRGDDLGLTEEELAFYDALETNDSAVKILGDVTLRAIAHDLVDTVRATVTIDWTLKETVRAKIRVMVKRILKKHGYPPDKQDKATATVLKQAELLCAEWGITPPPPAAGTPTAE